MLRLIAILFTTTAVTKIDGFALQKGPIADKANGKWQILYSTDENGHVTTPCPRYPTGHPSGGQTAPGTRCSGQKLVNPEQGKRCEGHDAQAKGTKCSLETETFHGMCLVEDYYLDGYLLGVGAKSDHPDCVAIKPAAKEKNHPKCAEINPVAPHFYLFHPETGDFNPSGHWGYDEITPINEGGICTETNPWIPDAAQRVGKCEDADCVF